MSGKHYIYLQNLLDTQTFLFNVRNSKKCITIKNFTYKTIGDFQIRLSFLLPCLIKTTLSKCKIIINGEHFISDLK